MIKCTIKEGVAIFDEKRKAWDFFAYDKNGKPKYPRPLPKRLFSRPRRKK